MSNDASVELMQAIIGALKADSAVNAVVAKRIYDRVPIKEDNVIAQFPFISFGPEQEIPLKADCIDGGDIIVQLDLWFRDEGRKQAKQLGRIVKNCLDDADLTLPDNALVCLSYEGRQVLIDPDGLTTHVAMTFQATVEEH